MRVTRALDEKSSRLVPQKFAAVTDFYAAHSGWMRTDCSTTTSTKINEETLTPMPRASAVIMMAVVPALFSDNLLSAKIFHKLNPFV